MVPRGRWHIIEVADYVGIDSMQPGYILFQEDGSGEIAFDCTTGHLSGAGNRDYVTFFWEGNEEMDEAAERAGPNFSRTA